MPFDPFFSSSYRPEKRKRRIKGSSAASALVLDVDDPDAEMELQARCPAHGLNEWTPVTNVRSADAVRVHEEWKARNPEWTFKVVPR